jgi:hypothetical protein
MIQGFSSGLIGNRELIYETDLPSFQRDFAALKTLDHGTGPAITFTRASGATYFDANGVLQTATNNTPRFDHDPANGASRGLLIEESRSNLHLYSQDFSQGWVATASSALAVDSTQTGLDGTLSVGAFTCSDDTQISRRLRPLNDIAIVSGTEYTFSAYLKPINGWPMAMLHFSTGVGVVSQYGIATFNLLTGTVASTVLGTATITAAGNGWYRCSLTSSGNLFTTVRPKIVLVDSSDDTAAEAVTGITGAGVYVWGAQLEAGLFPTSYIPTTTAAATRAADSAVVTPISSFYNGTESTVFSETSAASVAFDSTVLAINNTTQNEQLDHRYGIAGLNTRVRVGGVNQAAFTLGSAPVSGTVYKLIGAYKQNDFAFSVNGSTASTDSLGDMPTGLSQMEIGRRTNSGILTGHIRKLAYWPKRLSDTLLQQLTT